MFADTSIRFQAEYTNITQWKHGEKQYSEGMSLNGKIYHFYCQPDEQSDVLRIYVRCNEVVTFSLILVTGMTSLGELVLFRTINRTIDGAIGTVIKISSWSDIKKMTSNLSQSGKLTFIIDVVL